MASRMRPWHRHRPCQCLHHSYHYPNLFQRQMLTSIRMLSLVDQMPSVTRSGCWSTRAALCQRLKQHEHMQPRDSTSTACIMRTTMPSRHTPTLKTCRHTMHHCPQERRREPDFKLHSRISIKHGSEHISIPQKTSFAFWAFHMRAHPRRS